ncbi:MAG TPA: nuclear transport factor 2 family protein [Actinomadura sp.]|nr:nuclear transport factor 2 family protein [Actinomadura sp.]
MTSRPPLPPFPPFDERSALEKVQAAEDRWNTRDPEQVVIAYTEDARWRNRSRFFYGHDEIVAFLRAKWAQELDYALRKELWTFTGDRIAVRFQYECRGEDGRWWRCYGNELWEFAPDGLVSRREASINDRQITEDDRRIFGPRPVSERGRPLPFE